MSELLFSRPVFDYENKTNAPCWWRIYHYFISEDGVFSVSDEDGDHETIDEEDVPSQAEVEASEHQYFHWVVEQGKDPLNLVRVNDPLIRFQEWEAVYQKDATSYLYFVCAILRSETLIHNNETVKPTLGLLLDDDWHASNIGEILPKEELPQAARDYFVDDEVALFRSCFQECEECTEVAKETDAVLVIRSQIIERIVLPSILKNNARGLLK